MASYTPAKCFSWSWRRGGEAAGNITVRVEDAAVVLSYRSCRPGSSEWNLIQYGCRSD